MKKTKTIIKKQSKRTKTQKQKQKQSVNVNVHIDQSKRSQPRKPKSEKLSNLPTSMQSGQNYLSMPPPVIYQPPINTQYGLQPVTNQSNSLNRAIENEQNYSRNHSLVPSNSYSQYPFFTNPNYNSLSDANEKQRIKNEIESATQIFERFNNQKYNVEEIDDEQQINDIDENDNEEDVPELEPNDAPVDEQQIDLPAAPAPEQEQEEPAPIPAPIPVLTEENKNKKYFNALNIELVREYAQRLKIPIERKNKTNDYYSYIGKDKLIDAILKKL